MEKLTGQEIVQIAFLKALEMNKPHRSKRLCKLSKIIKYFHIQTERELIIFVLCAIIGFVLVKMF